MDLEEFKNYLINTEYIYPDYCKKENLIYNNSQVYSPQFNNKYIGKPIFYLVNNNFIKYCNNEETFEILNLLNKEN